MLCAFITAACTLLVVEYYDDILYDFQNLDIELKHALLISVTGYLSLMYHCYFFIIIYKEKKHKLPKVVFSPPKIFTYSTLLFSFTLISFVIIGMIKLPSYYNSEYFYQNLTTLILTFVVATWHILDVYFINNKINRHNDKAAIELDQIGQE